MNVRKQKVLYVLAGILFGSLFSSSVLAANYFKLRGTEPEGTAHTLQVWGFLQPTFVNQETDPIEGAFGPLAGTNGTNPVFATNPPDRTEEETFFMRRARIGIRGTMVPINNSIDYFILTEWGQNGVTRGGGAAHLLDASVTLNHLSRGQDDKGLAKLGARFRVGQFLFSQTSQALSQSTPGHRVHIFMPEMTFQNALYRPANDNGRRNFPDDVSVNAARDIGVEIFDWAEFGDPESPYEFTYSAAVGNGNTIGELDRDSEQRFYGWLSLAKLFDQTRGPRRHEIMAYAWGQKGEITFNTDIDNDGIDDLQGGGGGNFNPGNAGIGPTSIGTGITRNGNERDYEQKYYGYGLTYFDKPFDNLGQIRFEAEWSKVTGLIFDGAQFPSAATNENAHGNLESIRYDTSGTNQGWYVDAGYDIQKHIPFLRGRTTLNLRYDEYERNKGNTARELDYKAWTTSLEYFFHKKARLTFSYQMRDVDADDRLGNPMLNGNAVLDGVDNRFGVQLTFIYKNVLLR